jgi:hypothetical protein
LSGAIRKVNRVAVENLDTLSLESDIYSYTYFKFATEKNPILLGDLMVKCFMSIMIQIMLTYFKYDTVIVDGESPVFRGDAKLNVVRLICAFIMHIQMYPEVNASLRMLQYAVNNHEQFCQGSPFFPLVLAGLKCFGAIGAEVGNVYLIIRYQDVSSVIGGYVALAIVAKVDNLMAATLLTNVDIGGEISSKPLVYVKKQNIFNDIDLIRKWRN